MKTVPLRVPGAQVTGYTVEDYANVEDLTQDIVQIVLANGLTIDVGWHPEHDPSGSFVVRVFEGDWENRKYETTQATRSGEKLARLVEELVARLEKQPPLSTPGFV